jgi:hypothetical protein
MRRVLKELVTTGDITGNITPLDDANVIINLKAAMQ